MHEEHDHLIMFVHNDTFCQYLQSLKIRIPFQCASWQQKSLDITSRSVEIKSLRLWGPALDSGSDVGFKVSSSMKLASKRSRGSAQEAQEAQWDMHCTSHIQKDRKAIEELVHVCTH